MQQRRDVERTVTPGRGVRLLRPYAGWLLLVTGLLCLLAMSDMIVPFFLKVIIDDVFPRPDGAGGGEWHLLWLILPGIGLIYVTRNTLFYLSRMRSLQVSEDLCFDLRKRLFDHLQRLSVRYYRANQPGRVSSRVMDDTYKIQSFIQAKLPNLIRYLLEFQVLLIIIYLVNWRLALASTLVLPLHLWTFRRFHGSIRSSHSEAQESLALAHGNIVEKFLGMQVVKGFSAEDRESKSFREAIDASRRSTIRSQRFHFTQKVAADLVVGVGTVLLLGYGAWEVKSGRMTGGGFFMFFMYVRMLYPAVLEVISGASHLSGALGNADRIFEMLDEPAAEADVQDEDGDAAAAALAGGLELRDVRFAYDTDGPNVLEDVDLVIEPGEHVAITGPSGAGKSTLVSLLPRFNVPTGGEIRVDGRPAADLPLRSLRGLFGIAFQEVFLFNASIEENLRYARPNATMDEIREACRLTGAHEFIERLPEGYYTRLGGSGGELSRGEKQRITLARALVRDPRILILDEATASIDAPAARAIVAGILDRMEGRTVIMVTHHADLLDLFDRVVTVKRGRVIGDERPRDVHAFGPAPRPAGIVEPRLAPADLDDDDDADDEPRRRDGGSRPGFAGLVVLLALLVVSGCVRSSETKGTVALESPRVAGGAIIETDESTSFDDLAAALDRMEARAETAAARAAGPPPAADDGFTVPPTITPALSARDPRRLTPQQAAGLADAPELPADSVRLVTLPRVSTTEIDELVDRLVLRLEAEHGYTDAPAVLVDALPPVPAGIVENRSVARADGDATRLIHVGHRTFLSQPPVLRVVGVTIGADETLAANDELAAVEPLVAAEVESLNAQRQQLGVVDLESRLVQLSYIDANTAVEMLRGLGVTAFARPTEVPAQVEFAQLPYVATVPDPAAGDIGLVGEDQVYKGTFGLSLAPTVARPLSPNTIGTPLTQLLVMFHPAHPEQFSRVRSLLDQFIDRPARQIIVEGLVLEISEDGLRDLGIDWELSTGPFVLNAGKFRVDATGDTLELEANDLPFHGDFQLNWSARLRALIRDGKAEILSRPSVLTLNNRQSTIRVGEDIPIATSQEGLVGTSNKIAFSFQYLSTGILLNIRPRINEAGTQVSMLIDTIVSAVVPGADLEIRSTDGDLLASAPTVSTRRVQTYGRIANNTPFIVGGLVSRERTTDVDKVPLLGDLPIVGAAFRSERVQSSKTEVIIVLTPYVLPEDQALTRSLPKDEYLFDSFGNELFRDSYRIRQEDVFDLGFLSDNRRLTAARARARAAIDANFRLADQPPWSAFAGDRIPGEHILVTRMLYDTIKRLGVDAAIPVERMIFFEGRQQGGYDVRFIDQSLARLVGGRSAKDFFARNPDKAVALTYTAGRRAEDGPIIAGPVPELALVDCPDRDTWTRLLWELNRPTADGRERCTILIHDESDLVRLRRAITLKRIVTLNGGAEALRLNTFSVGSVLLMPDIKPEQIQVVDTDVARFFFHTEHYYAATYEQIEEAVREVESAE